MPGVGATLAYTLLALLPELGQIGRKQIAAMQRPDGAISKK
jgi:hypothetical protein